jgi:hypothetical protein
VGQTESATGEQPAPGEEAAAEQHGSDDNTSAVRREMNQTELSLARSQAVLIMHKLMNRLTKLVTRSLGSDNGSEEATMIAGEPEEHHRMLVTVRDQAAGLAQTEFQQISFGTPGIGPEAGQPEGRRRKGSAETSGTESMEMVNAAARALEDAAARALEDTAARALEGMTTVREQQVNEAVSATGLQATEEQTRFETEVGQVIAHAKSIMEQRSLTGGRRVSRRQSRSRRQEIKLKPSVHGCCLVFPNDTGDDLEYVRSRIEASG